MPSPEKPKLSLHDLKDAIPTVTASAAGTTVATAQADKPAAAAPARPAAVNRPAPVNPNPTSVDNIVEGAVVDPGSIAVEGENDDLPF